jgi:hypothetical protein
MRGARNMYRVLVGKPNGKRPFGGIRRRWVYNIKINLKCIGWYGVDWIHLAHLANFLVWSTCLVIICIQCEKRNI